jgi:hypothetical protein
MGHKTYFTFLYWPVHKFYSLTNTGSLFYLTTKYTLPVFGELYTQLAQRNECHYVTIIKIGMISKILIKLSNIKLNLFSSYSYVTCKKTDGKANGAFSSLSVVNTPNWE